MKKLTTAEIPTALLDMLMKESDRSHPLSMPSILADFADRGIVTSRYSVYHAIEILRKYGFPVIYLNAYTIKGYYLAPLLETSEVLLLNSMVKDSRALSRNDKRSLQQKLRQMTSPYMHLSISESGQENEESMLEKAEILLSAMPEYHPVEFCYFDINIYKRKQYRRNGKKYQLIPYALVPYETRFYCVFYDPVHHDFSNYRIDKMDHLAIIEGISADPVPFNLESYMQASFDMYHGEAETITIRCDKSMASLLFDQFDRKNIIIREIGENDFTVSLRTAVTPTLTAWLLLYYDRCTVLSPFSLKNRMYKIGISLTDTYEEK